MPFNCSISERVEEKCDIEREKEVIQVTEPHMAAFWHHTPLTYTTHTMDVLPKVKCTKVK